MTELSEVADTFNAAAAAGLQPMNAVMNKLGRSRPTASRQVAAARAAGLIAPELGESACINRKALRVAEALGVAYADLITALIDHAGGDLRVGTLTR